MQYRLFEISMFSGLITNGNSFWLVCKKRNAYAVHRTTATTRRSDR